MVAAGRFFSGPGDFVDVDYGGTGTRLTRTSGGGDALIAAYHQGPSGVFAWASEVLDSAAPGGQTVEATAIATAPSGDLYVGFNYNGPGKLAGGASLPDLGYTNVGVAKLDATGKVTLAEGYPTTKFAGGNPTQLLSARVDLVGDLVISGALSAPLDFGSGPTAYSGNIGDGFVVKLDPTLKSRWVQIFAAPPRAPDATVLFTDNAVDAVDFLPDNSIVAYGCYFDKTKFGGIQKSANGDVDGFLAFMKP